MSDKYRMINGLNDAVEWCNDNFDHFDARCDSIEDTTAKTFRLVDRKQKSDHGWINLAFFCIGALGAALYFQNKNFKKLKARMDSIEMEHTDLEIANDDIQRSVVKLEKKVYDIEEE